MNVTQLSQQIEALRSRVTTLLKHTKESSISPEYLLAQAFGVVDIALEELLGAEQELHQQNQQLEQQNQELKEARAAVEVECQLYQDLFEQAPDGYLVTNIEGVIYKANRAAAALLNVSQRFLVGKPLVVYVAQQHRQSFRLQLSQLPSTNGGKNWEVHLCPRNAESIDAAVNVTVIRDQEDKPIALRWLLRDISDCKLAEKTLQQLNTNLEQQVIERNAQLQQALKFEGMFKRITDKVRDSLDETQILQTAVQELALVLGVSCCNTALYNLEQGISTIYYEYATSSPGAWARAIQLSAFPEVYQQLLRGQYCQFCSLTLNLAKSPVAMLACPIFDDKGVLGDLWLVHHSYYAFNELEVRLVQQVASQCAIALRQARLYQASTAQVEELEKLNALKDDFLSTVSHELRTPMSNMKMAISMLRSSPTAERSQRYLEILQNECNREIDLINDLLDLQRLEVGTSRNLLVEAINLQEMLSSTIEPFYVRTQQHKQILQLNLPLELPPLLSVRAYLERIIVELLNNACKYTPAGGKIVVSSCYKAVEATTNFSISNSVEIPQAQIPLIFDKFYRLPNNDPWKQGGTGLGLALVKKLVECLQGTILVESQSGWTTFTVQIPGSSNSMTREHDSLASQLS